MPRLTDDDFEELRAEARELAEMRSEYFKLSKQAYRRGDKKQAKILSNQRKKFAALIEKANKSAADAIFNRNNQNRLDDTIDLHGLFVKEAIERLSVRVASAKRRNLDELTVIVGRGLHSQGSPKLKPAVIKYANSNGILHRMDSPNLRCIRFEFRASLSSESSLEDYPTRYQPALQKYHPSVSIPFIRPVEYAEVRHPAVRPYPNPIAKVSEPYVPAPRNPIFYNTTPSSYNPTPSFTITQPSSARIPSIRTNTHIDPESLDTEGCNPSKFSKISAVSLFVLVLIVIGALAYFNTN